MLPAEILARIGSRITPLPLLFSSWPLLSITLTLMRLLSILGSVKMHITSVRIVALCTTTSFSGLSSMSMVIISMHAFELEF